MANSDSAFRRWLRGEVDLSAELRTAEMPVPPEEARYQPRHHTAMIHMIFRQSHRFYVALVAVLCVLVCVDGLGSNHIAPADLLHLTVKGWNDCWLDFFDMLSEGVMMPLGGLLLVLMLGFETGTDLIRDECEATPGHRMRIYTFFKICVRVLTPIVMLIVLYGQIRAFFW